MELFFIFFGFGVFVIIGIAYSIYANKKRRQGMIAAAQQFGLSYSDTKSAAMNAAYPFITLFQKGHSRTAKNVLRGNMDKFAMELFDYRYTEGSGKNSSTHWNSVCILTVPEQKFKYILLRTEGFFDKVAGVFGYGDIQFESEEFNRRYYIKGDKEFALEFLSAEVREYLLARTKTPCMEMAGNALVFYFPRLIKPEEYADLCIYALEFYKTIPETVLAKYKSAV
ncbi:MAG: hypothetical protein HZA48_06085 [Planctomycetes bacterium]|nr:hypothetical protein [Planctomycetota bacterium]